MGKEYRKGIKESLSTYRNALESSAILSSKERFDYNFKKRVNSGNDKLGLTDVFTKREERVPNLLATSLMRLEVLLKHSCYSYDLVSFLFGDAVKKSKMMKVCDKNYNIVLWDKNGFIHSSLYFGTKEVAQYMVEDMESLYNGYISLVSFLASESSSMDMLVFTENYLATEFTKLRDDKKATMFVETKRQVLELRDFLRKEDKKLVRKEMQGSNIVQFRAL